MTGASLIGSQRRRLARGAGKPTTQELFKCNIPSSMGALILMLVGPEIHVVTTASIGLVDHSIE